MRNYLNFFIKISISSGLFCTLYCFLEKQWGLCKNEEVPVNVPPPTPPLKWRKTVRHLFIRRTRQFAQSKRWIKYADDSKHKMRVQGIVWIELFSTFNWLHASIIVVRTPLIPINYSYKLALSLKQNQSFLLLGPLCVFVLNCFH